MLGSSGYELHEGDVGAIPGHEARVAAEDIDGVGVAEGGEMMGDDDGAADGEAVDRLMHDGL